ncbi:MAG TPA: hypothetical protein VJI98_01810 [Candidatus Nanoarchaeia archaeon]|nr:hypothetical protein [Candidatus Nanoarchaeia archaeon]
MEHLNLRYKRDHPYRELAMPQMYDFKNIEDLNQLLRNDHDLRKLKTTSLARAVLHTIVSQHWMIHEWGMVTFGLEAVYYLGHEKNPVTITLSDHSGSSIQVYGFGKDNFENHRTLQENGINIGDRIQLVNLLYDPIDKDLRLSGVQKYR